MHILIVEDDALLAEGMTEVLRRSSYAVDSVSSGGAADSALATDAYDLVILDIELPVLDGFEVLRRLRARKARTPVIMLTARDALHDRIRGLDLGADDYLVKPFEMGELQARIRALLRRAAGAAEDDITLGDLRLDVVGRRLYIRQAPVDLTARELSVLEVLARKARRVVTKSELISSVFEWDDEAMPNTVEVYVSRLRKRLQDAGIEIRTVRGLGYLLEPSAPTDER